MCSFELNPRKFLIRPMYEDERGYGPSVFAGLLSIVKLRPFPSALSVSPI